MPAMIAVFSAVQWDNYGLLTIDRQLIYTVVEVLLGGRRGGPPAGPEGRPFTSIERALIERLIRLVLADMAVAFAPISAIEFRFERLETNPRFAAIARPSNGAVLFKLRIEMDDRGGPIEILIPYATLEPVRDLLLQMFMGEKFGRDSIWENASRPADAGDHGRARGRARAADDVPGRGAGAAGRQRPCR